MTEVGFPELTCQQRFPCQTKWDWAKHAMAGASARMVFIKQAPGFFVSFFDFIFPFQKRKRFCRLYPPSDQAAHPPQRRAGGCCTAGTLQVLVRYQCTRCDHKSHPGGSPCSPAHPPGVRGRGRGVHVRSPPTPSNSSLLVVLMQIKPALVRSFLFPRNGTRRLPTSRTALFYSSPSVPRACAGSPPSRQASTASLPSQL